jgi:hypothetical protein
VTDAAASFGAWFNNTPAPKNATPPAAFTGTPGTDAYANAALEYETAELAAMPPNSGRNDRLNTAAFNLGSLVEAGRLDRAYVTARLEQACQTNGLWNDPDDGPDSVRASIASGFRGAATKVGARVVPEQPDIPAAFTLDDPNAARSGTGAVQPNRTDNATEQATNAEDEACKNFTDGATFILDIPETIPSLWGDGNEILWMEGESLMIAGPMGLGKTTLGGQLMRAQLGIGGTTVLDLQVKRRGGRILYLAMDRPAQAARSLARQFKAEDRHILATRLVVWKGPPPADVAKYPDLLLWLAEQANADTVYLDSVKDAAIGLSDDEVGAGYNRARQKLLASGRQLCELHHTTKRGANGGPPKEVADVYGSTWITNGTGSVVLLTGDPGDPIVGFRHARQPMEEVGPYRLMHDQASGVMTVHHEADLVDMVRHAGPDGLTARDAAKAFLDDEDGSPSQAQVEKARRKLASLTEAGVLRCVEGTRGKGHSTAWFIGSGTDFVA